MRDQPMMQQPAPSIAAPPAARPATGAGPDAFAWDAAPGVKELESLLERFLGSIIPLAGASSGAVRLLTDDGAHMRLVGQLGLPTSVLANGMIEPRKRSSRLSRSFAPGPASQSDGSGPAAVAGRAASSAGVDGSD